MGTFAEALIKARTDAGFETAYKFYHRNGGKGHFPFTFVHYLRIEKGESLPRPEWVETLFLALRIMPTQAEARALLVAYLTGTLGGEKYARYILFPLFEQPEAGAEKFDPMKWMNAAHSEHLSPAEFSAMAADETAYWCAEGLFNEAAPLAAEELARKLGEKTAPVKAALAALVKAGLVLKAGKDKYRSRREGKFFTYPGRLNGMAPQLDKVRGYWEKARAKETGPEFERLCFVRGRESAMNNYRLNLSQAVDAANACIVNRTGPDTAFFLVEARIRKIKRF
jgi:hypothetical protein